MEVNKVAKNCKSVVLPSGIELTYCEFGEEHEEVVVTGAFYFHTFSAVVEELAKHYHVYGVVMRMSGEGSFFDENGNINWAKQWGDDIYQFTKVMGIEKFHYVGKCHGVVPGWYIIKNHPGLIESFCSFYLVPHVAGQTSDLWNEVPAKYGLEAHVKATMRKESSLPIKMAELKTVGKTGTNTEADKIAMAYAACPEKMWDSIEECEEFMKNVDVPICLCFGTDDLLYQDYYESNMKAIHLIPRAKTVILQGERHLMEIDCPERVASEMRFFIEESKEEYTK